MMHNTVPGAQRLFLDIKHMDSAQHVEGTGVPSGRILHNIRSLASMDWPGRMVIRTPIIPGYKDTIANAVCTANFLKEIGLNEINLLPFHRLAASKYAQLGMRYEYAQLPAHAPESLEPLAEVYRTKGIKCYLGSNTPL